MRSWQAIREDFPILKEKVNGKPLIYLDNAATTQIPHCVIDKWTEHYTKYNGNVHRGIHYLAEQSTAHMEDVRKKAENFLGMNQPCSGMNKSGKIIFTSGATDSANLVAQSFLKHRLKPGDVVVSTELEHHANYVVWQQAAFECGAEFRVIPSADGDLDMEAAASMLNDSVKFLAVTAVSNVLGTVVDIRKMIQLAHQHDIPVYIDAAQAMRHMQIDISELDCDFLGFSAHKMMGPTGVGCLFVHERYLDEMMPYRYGGGMIDVVQELCTTFGPLPARLEAGTPNYSGIIAFGAALDYLNEIGMERIIAREDALIKKMEGILRETPGVTVLGEPPERAGAVSILIDHVHPFDFAGFADQYGLAVRTGSMCAQPIVRKYGAETVIRFSTAFYNTEEELDEASRILKRVTAFLRSSDRSES